MAKDEIPSWALDAVETAEPPPPPPAPSFGDTAQQWLGVTSRALAPYATAATLGGAAAAPTGVGIPVGAAGGVLALGLGDLATGAYNLAAPAFGGRRVQLPSETIQNQFVRMGAGRVPQTPAQQVYSDVLQAGAGGLSQAKSASALADVAQKGRVKDWLQFFGQGPKAQTTAAMGGAAAPSIAANYFDVENPYALTGLSLAGGLAGGMAGGPRNVPTVEQLTEKANAAYTKAKQAGVRVSQPALSQLGNDIRAELRSKDFIPGSHPEVRRRLAQIDNEFKGPLDLGRLDSLHSDIAAAARTVRDDKTRMYMQTLAHKLDDFITNLDPAQTTSGNAPAAVAVLGEARQLWRSKSQLSLVEDAITAARNRAQQQGIAEGAAIRGEFRKIVNNKRTFGRLAPEVQDAVKAVANGTIPTRGLDVIGGLSPKNRDAIIADVLAGASVWGATQHIPTAIMTTGGLMTAGGVAKNVANRMAVRQAQTARAAASGAKPAAPRFLAAPVAQQAVQAPRRGQIAEERRAQFEIPWWAQAR